MREFIDTALGLSGQSANSDFLNTIELWQTGEITALEMSEFIDNLTRVPGLQKAICDPRVPRGCLSP